MGKSDQQWSRSLVLSATFHPCPEEPKADHYVVLRELKTFEEWHSALGNEFVVRGNFRHPVVMGEPVERTLRHCTQLLLREVLLLCASS